MAVLLYLNLTDWDLRSSPDLTNAYLKRLSHTIVENELDVQGSTFTSISLFLFLLMKHDVQPPPPLSPTHSPSVTTINPHRPWDVGSLLKIAKRLSGESWSKLENTLRAFLQCDNAYLYAGDSIVAAGEGVWEDRVRQEILE
jgi:hypothetical protein